MALRELPLRSDLASYSFRTELDGKFYTWRFSWNTRMQKWFYDILTEDEVPILMGQPVFVNFAVSKRFKQKELPRGSWFFFDTSNKAIDPDRNDLGSRVILIYEDENE